MTIAPAVASSRQFCAVERALCPKRVHRLHKPVHLLGPVDRRGGEAQPLGAARHGREVDRLHVDPVTVQQHVAQLLGVNRIADDDRHDMAAVVDDRQAHAFEAELERLGLFLVLLPQLDAALEVLREVKTSKRPFEQLVKLYSDDTISKANGGNVGYLTRVTAVPTYYNAAKKLKVGQIYPDLVETRYGFHIIKLTGRRTYKQADRTQLRAIVFEAKRKQIFDRYFAQLKKKYKISTNKAALKSVKR